MGSLGHYVTLKHQGAVNSQWGTQDISFTYHGIPMGHEHSKVGEMATGAGGCCSVNRTGSVRKTRLDSLLMEAEMICELTTRPLVGFPLSRSILTVAFSVDKKLPRFL
uniref:Uncharacterized protein n=1 Tax=Erpetoichthys calabaricus TaxID=27687 RepID=A0A8C4TIC3_ERPCA